jgi:hypothetical protein
MQIVCGIKKFDVGVGLTVMVTGCETAEQPLASV